MNDEELNTLYTLSPKAVNPPKEGYLDLGKGSYGKRLVWGTPFEKGSPPHPLPKLFGLGLAGR